MTLEISLLIAAWVITTILLIRFTPREKFREAFVIFGFKQLLTWLLGLIVVQLGLIEYPIRQFPNATKTSFVFEFYIYPSVCVIFNLHYPVNKKKSFKFAYYAIYCSAITIIEVIVERYTQIITYLHWNWSFTWVTLFLTFYASRKFYVWFYRLNKKK